MGNVNIPVNVVQGVLQTPAKGNADKNNQKIVWIISNPPNSGIDFSTTTSPFVFPSPPPAGYDPWPGTVPVPGGAPNQWEADVNDVLPNNAVRNYKYDILYTDANGAQTMDPEIENQGYPPSPLEDPPKGEPGQPGQPGQPPNRN